MQIHELDTFTGTPGSGDWLAMDNGTETTKVEANNLGVTTPMTVAEAEAGSIAAPRVISPKTLHDYVDTNYSKGMYSVFKTSVSSLPTTITDARISENDLPFGLNLQYPEAQTGYWTVTTSNGSLQITGTIGKTTNVTVFLCKQIPKQ